MKNLPEKNLAVELLERLLEGEIKSRFASNVVQDKKFSELLEASLIRYRNRAIETAQVIEELIEMARSFNEAARRGEELGLTSDELSFYDAHIVASAALSGATTLMTEDMHAGLRVDNLVLQNPFKRSTPQKSP